MTFITANSGRKFAAHAVGLAALIIDKDERFLMLKAPGRDGWEPVNGAYDGDETLEAGYLREIHEEAGADIQVRPICAVHSYNFRYDESVPHMVSIVYLFEYLGGKVKAGDDMAGSDVRWMTADEITSEEIKILVPQNQEALYERARRLYRLLKDDDLPPMQPDMNGVRNKYGE